MAVPEFMIAKTVYGHHINAIVKYLLIGHAAEIFSFSLNARIL